MKILSCLFVVSLLSGCMTLVKKDLQACDQSMRVAERDLSGQIPYVRGEMIYRDQGGQLCKG